MIIYILILEHTGILVGLGADLKCTVNRHNPRVLILPFFSVTNYFFKKEGKNIL